MRWPYEYGQAAIVVGLALHYLLVKNIYDRARMERHEERAKDASLAQQRFNELYSLLSRLMESVQKIASKQTPVRKKPETPGQQEGL